MVPIRATSGTILGLFWAQTGQLGFTLGINGYRLNIRSFNVSQGRRQEISAGRRTLESIRVLRSSQSETVDLCSIRLSRSESSRLRVCEVVNKAQLGRAELGNRWSKTLLGSICGRRTDDGATPRETASGYKPGP